MVPTGRASQGCFSGGGGLGAGEALSFKLDRIFEGINATDFLLP